MRLVNAQPKHTSPFWVMSRPARGDWRAMVALKAGYRLVPGGVVVPDEEKTPVASGDDPAEPGTAPRYASDFVPYKPQADILAVGAAHSPGGKPVGSCRVSIAIGEHRKSLAVFGDRRWGMSPFGAHPSKPVPFFTMPLGYERAFGGPNYRRNPVGCGADVRSGKPLPNIEQLDQLISQSLDRPDPAGFGPLGMTWQPRIGKAGTYDAAWQDRRWPWFPADFDWSFFNAAPADQQFPFFRGDELLAFENLHPVHALYRTRLPGVVARIFVARAAADGEERFEEVQSHLDTVWVDMAAERLILLWRGVTRVRSPRLREIAAICTTLEPLEAPRELEAHRTMFSELREAEARSRDARARSGYAEMTAERAEIDRARPSVETRLAEARALVASVRQTADGMLRAMGVDVATRRARLAKQDPMAALEHAIASLKEADPAKGEQLEQRLEEMDQRLGEAMGRVGEALRRPITQPPWTAERVREALTAGAKSLANAKLDGLDLTEIDFAGADLQQATLTGATLRNARFERANLAGANLRKCDLSWADFRVADLSRTNLREATVQGANFTGARLDGAVLAKLDLTDADFTEAAGTAADFTEAVLDGACFANASLPQGRFSSVRAAGADFTEAILVAADFAGAKARGVIMEGADLTNLRASRGADFTKGRFAQTHAPLSVWQQAVLEWADFGRAVLTQAQFPEAALATAVFDRAHLQGTNFEDAVLTDARLTNANLLRASFERADLTRACVDRSNLYGAGFLDATLEEATFRGSFVAQTRWHNNARRIVSAASHHRGGSPPAATRCVASRQRIVRAQSARPFAARGLVVR